MSEDDEVANVGNALGLFSLTVSVGLFSESLVNATNVYDVIVRDCCGVGAWILTTGLPVDRAIHSVRIHVAVRDAILTLPVRE